ncbi:serine/threonine protein kinase [Nitrospira sp. Kam-Ns4a]
MAQTLPHTLGDRYHVLKILREGQGIETFLGRDLQRRTDVVIKAAVAAALTAATVRRLERETEALRELATGCLAPPLLVTSEAGRVYVVTSFVPGVSLRTRLACGPLPVREAITVGCCLMDALRTAHAHGVLHLHIKPADLILDRASSPRQATLVDFGLARGRQLDTFLESKSRETAVYASPEQAGALAHQVDQRADLYSAGIVLFECLAGQPPFQGQTVGDLLRQHVTTPPPSLRARANRPVPRALDEIVQRLLRKDPQDRYQTAAAVLADLQELARAWDQGDFEPELVVGTRDRRRTLTAPAFVGRAKELAALLAEFQLARQGHGRLVVVEGESGSGKTCLLEELAHLSAGEGARLLRGQGVVQSAQRPFQVLDDVVSALRAAAQCERSLVVALRDRLPDQAARAAACTAMPQLAEVLGPGPGDTLGPEAYGETRSLSALTRVLDAVGTPDQVAVVLLDDCQWADEQTVKLLKAWQRRRLRGGGADCHVLIVVAFRPEEVPAGHALRSLSPSLHLRLEPFGADAIRGLVESMAGPVPDEALAVVSRVSGGSPFMVMAILRGLVETGALVAEPDLLEREPQEPVWRMKSLALTDVQSSRMAAAFLTHRLDLLPAETLYLLSVGAVLG